MTEPGINTEENEEHPLHAETNKAAGGNESDEAIKSMEDAFKQHEKGRPADNIQEPEVIETILNPPDPEKDAFKDWFFSKNYVEEIITGAVAWLLENGNVAMFNMIYANKYPKLNADDIKIDEEDRETITRALHAIAPKFYAWIKKLPVPVLALIALEYGIWMDMKEQAKALKEEEDKKEQEEESKPKPAEPKMKEEKKPEQTAATTERKEKKPVEIKMPDFKGSALQVIINKWLKKEGENVKAGEDLVQITTDTGHTWTIISKTDNVLTKILCKEGETIATGLPYAMVA